MKIYQRGRRRFAAACAIATSVLMLAACDSRLAQWCAPPPVKDWALDDAQLQLPRPSPIELNKLNAEVIASHYIGHVKFTAAVLSGDYAAAQNYWDEIASIADPTERMRAVYQFHFAMQGRGFYFLHAARAWLRAEPNSRAASLLMGLSLSDGALQARGGAYSAKTSNAQMALFAQRFFLADPYLGKISRGKDPLAWAATMQLQQPYFFLGESQLAWAGIEYLIQQAPQYEWTYIWATEYAQPRWADDEGPAALRKLSELASKNQLNTLGAKVLAQQIQYVSSNMENNGNPQAWRPYWQNRLAEAPHLYNILKSLRYELNSGNWLQVEALSTQAIEINPHQTFSFQARARARKELERGAEAFKDTLAAAVLGDDDAMERIVSAYVQGGMAVKPGDLDTLLAYCRMGAAFGLPSAANCVGASYTDGFGGVVRDNGQSAAWHLLGARGGNINSQHDVAMLLPQVQSGESVPGVTQYWMKESARKGHAFASKKVDASEDTPTTVAILCRLTDGGDVWSTLKTVLTHWLRW